MKRVALALILSASIGLPSANAAEFVYGASLSGLQEEPAVVTPGTGFTVVTYDDVLHTLRVQFNFSGLIGMTTAAHIHVRPSFMPTGGVATQVPSFGGFPLGVTSGSYDQLFDLTLASSWNPAFITNNGGTTGGAESALFAALQDDRAYLNIHSSFRLGGEIRGNLAAVPEPAAWATMLLGFLGLGSVMRRRRAVPRASISYA